MLTDALDFVKSYLDNLNDSLKAVGGRLTMTQGGIQVYQPWLSSVTLVLRL